MPLGFLFRDVVKFRKFLYRIGVLKKQQLSVPVIVVGNITVGDNSYIGSNAVVIKDVPANSTVVGVPGRVTKQDGKKLDTSLDHAHVLDPIMQSIEELQKRLDNLEK